MRPTAANALRFVLAAALSVATAAGWAAEGAKLPRFASLRAGEVNVRTGPGVRYPVDWVFVSRRMPVEIIAEFDTWRKVRDWEGTVGWVHQSMLSGRRSVIVVGGPRALRRRAADSAAVIAQVEERVVGRLSSCEAGWCRAEFGGHRGWIRRAGIWGVYRDERFE